MTPITTAEIQAFLAKVVPLVSVLSTFFPTVDNRIVTVLQTVESDTNVLNLIAFVLNEIGSSPAGGDLITAVEAAIAKFTAANTTTPSNTGTP